MSEKEKETCCSYKRLTIVIGASSWLKGARWICSSTPSYKGCLEAYHLSPEMTIESPEQKLLTNQGSAFTARAVPGRDRPALERAASA